MADIGNTPNAVPVTENRDQTDESPTEMNGAPVSPDDKQKADQLKEKANEFFKKEDYNQAITFYTQAIELDPTVAAYYGNRSFAYLRTECFGYALADANKALEIDPKYIKAYYRRASSYMALGKFKLALKDFETVTKVHPSDKDAKAKYTECNKIVKRIAFEKAIAVDDHKSVLDSIDIETMAIDDDYDGPKLEDGVVTLQFVKDLLKTFKEQKKLHRKYAYQILLQVREIFMKQPSLVDITIPDICYERPPVLRDRFLLAEGAVSHNRFYCIVITSQKIIGKKFTVCGDIHGQYYDLLNIFELNGIPSESNPYLFNGDFVDRGSFSVECILVLFSFKLLYPDHFFMARGNHESATMNQMYGFEGEVKSKFTAQMADLFTEVFNWLPLAHCINNRILVMHGGLFKDDNVTLDDIRKVDRHRQPPEEGVMCELLWSDPQPQCGRSQSKRGVGTQFGPDVTKRFLQKNKLDYIIRSHEVKNEGYEVSHDGKCITVFSAPNYCDTMGNKGAFITLIGGTNLQPKFTSYEAVPHPSVKPMAYASSLFGLF